MLNYRTEAVSVARGGIVEKSCGWNQPGRVLLGVEDPQQVREGGGSLGTPKRPDWVLGV